MKMTKTIGLVVLMTLLTSFAYWLGYRHGSIPTRARIATVSSLRQLGLRFRDEHNDITRFSATGTVTTPSKDTRVLGRQK